MANDFLPFGTSETANVLPQSEYAALPARAGGYSAGTAVSKQLNKTWRQSSVMASVLAQFISDYSRQDVLDNGDLATIQTNLGLAVRAAISAGPSILTGTAVGNAFKAPNSPVLTAFPSTGFVQMVRMPSANTGAATYAPDALAVKPIYGLGLQPLQGGEIVAGLAVLMYLVQAGVNGGNGAWILIYSMGAPAQILPGTKSLQAVQRTQLGGYNSYVPIGTGAAALEVGKCYLSTISGANLTLPTLASTDIGATVTVVARLAANIIVNGAGQINLTTGGSLTTLVLRPGEQAQLVSDGSAAWTLIYHVKNPQYPATFTAMNTAGTSTAQNISPVPALIAYEQYQTFLVQFQVNSGASPTFSVSGIGPRPLIQNNPDGVGVPATFKAGQIAYVCYDGNNWVILNPLPTTAVAARQSYRGTTGLKGSANGTTASIPYTIGEAIVAASTGPSVVLTGVSLTLNAAATASATVSGMVGGAATAGTWYATYLHYNPTTLAMVLTGDPQLTSPSAAPSAGFTHWVRIGSWRAEASGIPRRFMQIDSSITINPLAGTNVPAALAMATGALGSASTPTWGAVPLGAFVPTTASKVRFYVNSYAAAVIVAPNNQYTGISTSSVRGAPVMLSNPAGYAANQACMGEFVIESANIYYASDNANGGLMCMGYEDTI